MLQLQEDRPFCCFTHTLPEDNLGDYYSFRYDLRLHQGYHYCSLDTRSPFGKPWSNKILAQTIGNCLRCSVAPVIDPA
jgi:hypothetical protein